MRCHGYKRKFGILCCTTVALKLRSAGHSCATTHMLSEFKPYLTALVMPPTSLLLGVLIGLIWSARRPRPGKILALCSASLLWLLATPAFSVWISHWVLPQFPMTHAQALTDNKVQAIVVLGAGVESGLPDGVAQLKRSGLDRLRHGAELARATGLPLAIAGGRGWGSAPGAQDEASVSERVAKQAFGLPLRWAESQSRDTQENALFAHRLLKGEGIERIALVTHSWHMPRALAAFESVGFTVTPAPMGQPTASGALPLQWFPSAGALETSTSVRREALAVVVQARKGPLGLSN